MSNVNIVILPWTQQESSWIPNARSLNSRESRTFSSFFEDFCWIYSQIFNLSNGLEVLLFSVRKNMDVTKIERLSNFALTQNHRNSAVLAVLRFTVTVGSSNMSIIHTLKEVWIGRLTAVARWSLPLSTNATSEWLHCRLMLLILHNFNSKVRNYEQENNILEK